MSDFLRMSDCRYFKYCAPGVRRFCARHEINFKLLISGKLPISEFERTGDGMALRVVAFVKGGRQV